MRGPDWSIGWSRAGLAAMILVTVGAYSSVPPRNALASAIGVSSSDAQHVGRTAPDVAVGVEHPTPICVQVVFRTTSGCASWGRGGVTHRRGVVHGGRSWRSPRSVVSASAWPYTGKRGMAGFPRVPVRFIWFCLLNLLFYISVGLS